MNREDAHFVMHLHTDQGAAVAAQKEGLLPLTQHALIVLPKLSYHDYEGIALNLDERERLVKDLGPDSTLMLLRNHGTLALGQTAADCWTGMFYLERACKMQVMALSAGRENVLLSPAPARREVDTQTAPHRRLRRPRLAGRPAQAGARKPGVRRVKTFTDSPTGVAEGCGWVGGGR